MNILDVQYSIQDQNKNRWVMLFPTFPFVSPYITQCSIPTYNFTVDEQTKCITGFEFLEDITITFIEDTLGTIQMFLGTLEALSWNFETKVFRDNQRLAKQTAILMMDDLDIGIPTISFRFTGLRYMGRDTLSLDYSGDDTLLISAHFSVSEIFPMFPLNGYGALQIP